MDAIKGLLGFMAWIGTVLAVQAAPGFYSVTQDKDGVWRGVRPDGTTFVPNGVVHVNLDASIDPDTRKSAYGERCRAKYGAEATWTTNTLMRLKDWGFNIIGCDSDYDRLFRDGPAAAMGFGYAYGLYTHRPLRQGACRRDMNYCITPQDGTHCGLYFPNVFHPDYARIVDTYCARECGRRKNDRALFGYYIANELAWWGRSEDHKSGEGLFDYVNTKLDAAHPARQALERIVAACGGDRDARTTKEKFLEAVAERFFRVNTEAIRRHDPNHLVLGCRFAGLNHPMLMRIAGKYCDVVTFNAYSWADLAHNEVRESRFGAPVAGLWKEMYALARKPLMITEWSYLALDRGHTSSRGAGMRVHTQAERVAAAELYLKTCLSLPFVLGTSYFRHADMPRTGKRGGEDCAYGLVDEWDEPYPELTAMFRRIHAEEGKLRRSPTPVARPEAPDGTMDAATFRARHHWDAGRLTFTRREKTYRLENAHGLFLEGKIGRGPLGFVGIQGTNVIRFVATARISKPGQDGCEWPDAEVVESAAWQENEQALYLSVCNLKTRGLGMAFRMQVRITVNAGGNGLMAEILSMKNLGKDRFAAISAYLRPYPCWKATAEGAHCVASPVYGSCAEARWDQPGEDRTCRCFTWSKNVENIRFVFYGNDWPHPDAIFRPQGGNVDFVPGCEHVFPESIYLVLEPGLKSTRPGP